MQRRKAMKLLGTIGLINPIRKVLPLSIENPISSNIHLFSKHLQWLDYEGMSKVAKEIGFDGLDLTVRRKGHVLPENVERDLPKAVAAMQKLSLIHI